MRRTHTLVVRGCQPTGNELDGSLTLTQCADAIVLNHHRISESIRGNKRVPILGDGGLYSTVQYLWNLHEDVSQWWEAGSKENLHQATVDSMEQNNIGTVTVHDGAIHAFGSFERSVYQAIHEAQHRDTAQITPGYFQQADARSNETSSQPHAVLAGLKRTPAPKKSDANPEWMPPIPP